jgi:hypothetical protein
MQLEDPFWMILNQKNSDFLELDNFFMSSTVIQTSNIIN